MKSYPNGCLLLQETTPGGSPRRGQRRSRQKRRCQSPPRLHGPPDGGSGGRGDHARAYERLTCDGGTGTAKAQQVHSLDAGAAQTLPRGAGVAHDFAFIDRTLD